METTYPLRRLAPYGGDAMNRILPDTLAYVSSWVPRSDLLAGGPCFAVVIVVRHPHPAAAV